MEQKAHSLIGHLHTVSSLARGGEYSDAALEFNRCMLLLQQRMRLGSKDNIDESDQAQITESMRTMLLLLEHKDWVAIADLIDYEFIELVGQIYPE